MKTTTTALAVLAMLASASLASAANIQVNYRVDAKALKSGTPAGTPLTFQLYSDVGCTTAVGGSQVVNVENVSLIEQPKLIKVKNGPKPLQVAAIQYTMTGVTPQLQLYATVTGAGITAIGGVCQLQTASVGGGTSKSAVWVDANGKVVGPFDDYIGGIAVLLPTPSGVGRLLMANDGTWIDAGTLYYASTDCSGSALQFVFSQYNGLADVIQPFNGQLFAAPASGVSTQIKSQLSTSPGYTSQASCFGGTFVPPHGCCQSSNFTGVLGSPVAIDMSAYTTPFRITIVE